MNGITITEEMSPAEIATLLRWGPEWVRGLEMATLAGSLPAMLMLQRPQVRSDLGLPADDPAVQRYRLLSTLANWLSVTPGLTSNLLHRLRLLVPQ